MQAPKAMPSPTDQDATRPASQVLNQILQTPTTINGFNGVRSKLESNLDAMDEQSRLYLRKIANAAEKVYADWALLFDENRLLFEQNNENSMRESTRATIVGRTKVMSYEDIIEAQRKRCEKGPDKTICSQSIEPFRAPVARMVSEADEEASQEVQEIADMGLDQYCHVLNFKKAA